MSGGDEGEAPNSRCGGSRPTASLLAPFPGSHFLTPLFPVPLPLHLGLPMRGRRLTVGAVAHARRPHCSLSHFLTPLFPVPLPLHLGLPMRGGPNSRCGGSCPTASLLALLFPVPTFSPSTPWTTNEGEAPNSRCGGSCPTASLLALLFPFPTLQPPVSGSSTSTPWTTSSRSSTLSSLTLDLTPPSARSLNLASLRGGVCVYPLESEGSVRISFHFCFTAGVCALSIQEVRVGMLSFPFP